MDSNDHGMLPVLSGQSGDSSKHDSSSFFRTGRMPSTSVARGEAGWLNLQVSHYFLPAASSIMAIRTENEEVQKFQGFSWMVTYSGLNMKGGWHHRGLKPWELNGHIQGFVFHWKTKTHWSLHLTLHNCPFVLRHGLFNLVFCQFPRSSLCDCCRLSLSDIRQLMRDRSESHEAINLLKWCSYFSTIIWFPSTGRFSRTR